MNLTLEDLRNTLVAGSTVAILMLPGAAVSAEDPPAVNADVGRGALTWAENCMRCHNARDPQEFRDDLWKPIVFHMRVRAGLTGQESRDILAYLQSAN